MASVIPSYPSVPRLSKSRVPTLVEAQDEDLSWGDAAFASCGERSSRVGDGGELPARHDDRPKGFRPVPSPADASARSTGAGRERCVQFASELAHASQCDATHQRVRRVAIGTAEVSSDRSSEGRFEAPSTDQRVRSVGTRGERCGQLHERSHASQCDTTHQRVRRVVINTAEVSSDLFSGARSKSSSADQRVRSVDIEDERCGKLMKLPHASQCNTTHQRVRRVVSTEEVSSGLPFSERSLLLPDGQRVRPSGSRTKEAVRLNERPQAIPSDTTPQRVRGVASADCPIQVESSADTIIMCPDHSLPPILNQDDQRVRSSCESDGAYALLSKQSHAPAIGDLLGARGENGTGLGTPPKTPTRSVTFDLSADCSDLEAGRANISLGQSDINIYHSNSSPPTLGRTILPTPDGGLIDAGGCNTLATPLVGNSPYMEAIYTHYKELVGASRLMDNAMFYSTKSLGLLGCTSPWRYSDLSPNPKLGPYSHVSM